MATKTCTLMTGVGRSGTSALTGLTSIFGFDLGEDLLPADAANPKGYLEKARVFSVNQNLLRELGVRWAAFESTAKYLTSECLAQHSADRGDS